MPVQTNPNAKRIGATLAGVEYLAAPPHLSMRLMAIARDGKSSADDIAEIVLCSPAISATLLKLSNSAFYSRGESIDSVSRAIVRLGLKTVIQFVYAMDMMGVFRASRQWAAFSETHFWKNSLAGALLTQELAVSQGIIDSEPLFLAALMRDIGVLIVRQCFPDLFEDTIAHTAATQTGFSHACSEVCGIDHRSIAFLVAMRWNLPAAVTVIFQPPAIGNAQYDRLLSIRNIVRFVEYTLTVKRIYTWDTYAKPDSAVGAALYFPADAIDASLSSIVAEVNGFFERL